MNIYGRIKNKNILVNNVLYLLKFKKNIDMKDEINVHNEVIFIYDGERRQGKVTGFDRVVTEEGKTAIITCTDGSELRVLTNLLKVINYND
jgi:hypothetical protein